MNNVILEQKINSLKTYKELNSNAIDIIGKILNNLSDFELFRINPIAFAKQYGLHKQDTIDIFIHAAKIGMFDFEWNMICNKCGGVVKSFQNISSLNKKQYHCSYCDLDVLTDLSDFVEVAFNINDSIHKLSINPFQDLDTYFKSFFSRNFILPLSFQELQKTKLFKAFKVIKPGENNKIMFDTLPKQMYRLISLDNDTLVRFMIKENHSDIPQILDIDLLPSGFSPDTFEIPSGNVTINVNNRLHREAGMILNYIDRERIIDILSKESTVVNEFLTGKNLLNNQSFRDLFRSQLLPIDMQLKVSNITILFTDLKGSTELYEKTGDMFAYNLVQKHFDLLRHSTRSNSGAIIKTIGDAIMASFSTPADGLRAAFDMVNKIKSVNEEVNEHDVKIKVGLHTGTALAVTANDMLDYFGQTVNLAARVQGLADGDEIWITEDILNSEGVRDVISNYKVHFEKNSAVLKGVSMPTTVYRCFTN